MLQRIKEGYDHDAWFVGTRRKGNKPNTAALLQNSGAWYTAKQCLMARVCFTALWCQMPLGCANLS